MTLSRRNFLTAMALATGLFVGNRALAENAGYKDITFDDIKLPLEKDEKFVPEKHLNEKVEKLEGQKIRIRGWIHPSVFTQTGITQFVLVRDNQECCFGPGAALHDCIVIEMESGKSTNFTTRPIAVEGIFKLQEIPGGPKGRQLAIYSMKAISAK
jgi:hypothetical protein